NPDLKFDGRSVLKHSVEIRWERVASAAELTLTDTLVLRNLTSEPIRFSVELRFDTAFEDIFAIRGLFQGKRGTCDDPMWENDTLQFRYAGADKIERALAIRFSPSPDQK